MSDNSPASIAVFGRDATSNKKSLYATTDGGQLVQIWDDGGWHLDFPAEAAGHADLTFTSPPAVFGRDITHNKKSIYATTKLGRLAQIWDDGGWHLDFPAEAAGQPDLLFLTTPAVFGRDQTRNTKSIYASTSDSRLAQIWDDRGWHLDFPAEAAGLPGLKFQSAPAVFRRDAVHNTKSIYATTSDNRLVQMWDDRGWHLDFPAEAAGLTDLNLLFAGPPAVFGRDSTNNKKALYAVTLFDGHLTQIWDDGGWHFDFPAEAAGHTDLAFTGTPAVFGRDLTRNLKSVYAVTADHRLAQIWDDGGWHVDFPAEAAGHPELRFTGTPGVMARSVLRNMKSLYVLTDDNRLVQMWDDDGWHLDFPAEAAGHADLRFVA